MTLRLLQCSDFHLDARPHDDPRRMEVVRQLVQRLAPDLIVFTGDLVELGPQDADSLRRGRDLLASFGCPFYALPGNHDVGNKLSIGRHVVTEPAVGQWIDILGNDRFVCDVGGWRLIGINSQITGSGLARERDQLHWLQSALDTELPIALFSHMPPYLYQCDENPTGREAYWQIDPEPRQHILHLLDSPNVRLVASGHVHWHATFNHDSLPRLWCPACYSVVHEPHYPPGGNVTGMVLHTLDSDWTYELIADEALSRPQD
ncbi:MAG: metallophosphoesterase [Phycisphaeraceae bacterium]|nr:metallophosphoesterase [Phycisphaeraceae bacterium]